MINFIECDEKKRELCESVLRDLPEWFGIEESIQSYIRKTKEQVMIAYGNLAFLSLENTGPYSMDIHVLGVLKKDHHKGIGKALIMAAESYALSKGKKYITVKTLSSKNPDPHYQKTREFYEHMGFYTLDELPTLWDLNNPCLYMIKEIETYFHLISETVRLRKIHRSDYRMVLMWYRELSLLKSSVRRNEIVLEDIIKKYNHLQKTSRVYIIEYFTQYWHPIGVIADSQQNMPLVIDSQFKALGLEEVVISYLHKKEMEKK